jgi:hypothetical protein
MSSLPLYRLGSVTCFSCASRNSDGSISSCSCINSQYLSIAQYQYPSGLTEVMGGTDRSLVLLSHPLSSGGPLHSRLPVVFWVHLSELLLSSLTQRSSFQYISTRSVFSRYGFRPYRSSLPACGVWAWSHQLPSTLFRKLSSPRRSMSGCIGSVPCTLS